MSTNTGDMIDAGVLIAGISMSLWLDTVLYFIVGIVVMACIAFVIEYTVGGLR